MAEDAVSSTTMPAEPETMKDAPEPTTSTEPSTSTEKSEEVDVSAEAKKLLGVGHRHLVMKDVRAAVNAFQEASSLLAKKYGDTADECAEAFFSYGMSLLELARMENGVLGNALEGMPEEEEDGEKEEDPNIPSAANLNEEGNGTDSEENEGTEKENDEEEVGNLQLAWEMLDLSKLIFQRQKTKASQLKAAQAHLKLGEVSVESENYSQAVEDFLACLKIQNEHLEEHDRLLAETHYQLGLAYQYSCKHEDAISHFTKSVAVIEKRMVVLTGQLEKAGKETAAEVQKEMDELKGLLPDIKEKIEDSKEAQKNAKVTEIALKETLGGGPSGFSQENGSTSASTVSEEKTNDAAAPTPTNCVSDISHLVRKKRKPEEESPLKDKEAKKSKQELVENGGSGDAVVPTNEEAEKAEEADKQTPMETAAVESTA